MRILIFMCGEGLGHTSRCISLGHELLSAGHEVFFGAYGYSKELIEKTGYRAYEIPSEIKLVGKSGSLDMTGSVKATIRNAQFFAGPKVLKIINEIKPDAVVSDSYYLGVVGAKSKRIPVYFIVNQTDMRGFFHNRGTSLKILGRLAKNFYSTIFSHMDKIIIPDFPPPYTICRRNLSFDKSMVDKVFFSGPLVRRKYGDINEIEGMKKPHVLSMIGGFGYREILFRNIVEASNLDSKINYTLISGPSVDMDKFGNLPGNVGALKFIDDPFPYIKGADVIIAPGGHSTIMEALSFGKPLLSFPDMFHSEQESNAAVLSEDGLGKCLSYFTPPKVILECIREVLSEKSFRNRAGRLRKLSEELNGPAAIRELLESR